MRTITITKTICQFDELTDKAKERAYNEIIGRYSSFESQCHSDDYKATLEEMEKVFHIKVYNWEVEGEGRYNFQFDFTTYRWDSYCCDYEDEPRMLVRYLNNEIFPMINGKYYGKCIRREDGTYDHKKRYSKIRMENCGCLLTGVCTDKAFDDAVYNAYEFVRRGYTIREYVLDTLEDFFSDWGRDLDYMYSEDFILDMIDTFGLEFYEDGTIYGES